MDPFAIFGYLLVCFFYPSQIFTVLKRKSAGDFSLFSLWMMVIGLISLQISMMVYGGYLIYQIGNSISLAGAIGLLTLRYIYPDRYNKKPLGM